jgi:polyribonucleotide nucleotidyltransferase
VNCRLPDKFLPMKPTVITKSCSLPDGRQITIETGKLARQADGSVVLRMGNTMLLATAVASPTAKEGTDFLPLSVDYQEKFASTGKIPGGFLKREGKLSDYEVLISRLVTAPYVLYFQTIIMPILK